ncbi:MAG TPA: ABC transporter permease [Selenomonadales bacterium]|nr:ABC transporter permease [Selenomonadales bacterium]
MSHAVAAPPDDWDNAGPWLRYVKQVLTIVEMDVRKLWKDPTELLMRGVQPALWLVIFGQSLGRIRGIPTGNVSYEAFLAPGVFAQSITFISIFYGISILWDRDMGLLQKIMCTPIPPSAMIIGKMLSASFRSISQVGIMILLSLLLNIPLDWNILSILGVLLTVILGGVFFAGMSMAIASLMKTRERMLGIGQLITMPLFFSSSAIYPIAIMPPWLQVVAKINPMSYLVDGLRNLLLHAAESHLLLDWGVLIVASLVMIGVNTLLFPRILNK